MRRGVPPKLALIVMIMATASCTRDAGTSPAPTGRRPSSSDTSSVAVAHQLVAAPTDCHASDPLVRETRPWGRLLGSAPAFGAFYARADRASGSFTVGEDTRRTPHGWAVKVLWLLEPGTSVPVTLSGSEVETGSPIWFDPSDGASGDTMSLDPKHPGTPSQRHGWKEYPSLLEFPEAGCYRVQASWANGSWQWSFGFGA